MRNAAPLYLREAEAYAKRQRALELAVQTYVGIDDEKSLVRKATAFLNFLNGKKEKSK